MNIFFRQPVETTEDELARARPADEKTVTEWFNRLSAAKGDAARFKPVFEALSNDKAVGKMDMIALAQRFVGGAKAKSKTEALSSIKLENTRLLHAAAKTASAGRSKTW
jgi:hypothetical protein